MCTYSVNFRNIYTMIIYIYIGMPDGDDVYAVTTTRRRRPLHQAASSGAVADRHLCLPNHTTTRPRYIGTYLDPEPRCGAYYETTSRAHVVYNIRLRRARKATQTRRRLHV